MSNLTTQPSKNPLAGLGDEQTIDLVKNQIFKGQAGATLTHLKYYLWTAKTKGLNPLTQLHAVFRFDKKSGKHTMSIQTGIDGFRAVAQKSGEYEGQTPAEWCGEDGKWLDVWLSDKFPLASRVGVYRKNFKAPCYAVAKWGSYVATFKDGTPNTFWKKMPDLMLAKCAEALALRKAFPEDLSGLYTSDEMQSVGNHEVKDVLELEAVGKASPVERDVVEELVPPSNDVEAAGEAPTAPLNYALTTQPITYGKKYAGRVYGDVNVKELGHYADWLRNQGKDKYEECQKFLNDVDSLIALSLEKEKAEVGTAENNGDIGKPEFDSYEESPF